MSSTNSGSETVTESGLFEVREFAEFSISGPSDNRIIITPGEDSSISLNLIQSRNKRPRFHNNDHRTPQMELQCYPASRKSL